MKLIIYIVCSLLLFSCRNNNEQNAKKQNVEIVQKDVPIQDEWQNKFEKQKQFLHGRKISSISTVLDNMPVSGNSVLLVYNELDCGDCVKKGFSIINKLDSEMVPNTFVITTTPNPGRHQLLYDYPKYVYVDKQDLIRKDLKYVTTPILLVLNKHKQIQHVLFPGVAPEGDEYEFMKYCLK